jgi:hypothetical protein
MSASLHPTEIHRRQHLQKKRNKLRARLAAGTVVGRAALEAKLQKTYSPGCGPSKSGADDRAAAPVSK